MFHKQGTAWLERRPIDEGTHEPIEVLDLPPQVTVTKELSRELEGDELKQVKESDKIEFIADIPGKGENAFKVGLPLWGEGRAPARYKVHKI